MIQPQYMIQRDLVGCQGPRLTLNNYAIVPDEARYCMVLLLQQHELVLVSSCNLEFQHFKIFNF
jgi:hypothetical protein